MWSLGIKIVPKKNLKNNNKNLKQKDSTYSTYVGNLYAIFNEIVYVKVLQKSLKKMLFLFRRIADT